MPRLDFANAQNESVPVDFVHARRHLFAWRSSFYFYLDIKINTATTCFDLNIHHIYKPLTELQTNTALEPYQIKLYLRDICGQRWLKLVCATIHPD